jgi:hypothetical protein
MWYCGYFAVKQWLMAGALIALAVLSRRDINGQYNPGICRQCADQAKLNPTQQFEFGICNSLYTPAITGRNLLLAETFSPQGSPVSMMFISALILTAAALAYTVRLWCWPSDDFISSGVTNGYNVLLTLIYMMISGVFFQLYLSRDGCYVSPWNEEWLFINYVANLVVLLPIIIYSVFDSACGKSAPKLVTAIWFWLSVASVVGFVGLSFFLAAQNMQQSHLWTQLIFISSVCVVCFTECSLFRICFPEPPAEYKQVPGKENITAEQKANSFKDNIA